MSNENHNKEIEKEDKHNHENCDCGEDCSCGDEEEFIGYVFTDEDGKEIECELVEIFEFEDREYGLLVNMEDDSATIMRLDGEDSEGIPILEEIDEEEFNTVSKHYENLVASDVIYE